MLRLTLVFLVIAMLGGRFGGVASSSLGGANILFLIFVVFAGLSFVLGRISRRPAD